MLFVVPQGDGDDLGLVAGEGDLVLETVRLAEKRKHFLELLDSNPVTSIGDFSSFIDPLIQSWDFDLNRFTIQVTLASGVSRKFGFHEETSEATGTEEPALRAFLRDTTLSANATTQEIDVLRRMRFPATHRPIPLFYYRMLQNLRDPLHFRERRLRRTGD